MVTTTVRVETEKSLPLAVIYNGGEYGKVLKDFLYNQNIRVIHLEESTQALSVLEKPAYIFFFAKSGQPIYFLKDQLSEASQLKAKLIVILDNLDTFTEKALVGDGEFITVEIKGELTGESLKLFVAKLVRLVFSPRTTERQVVIGIQKDVLPKITSIETKEEVFIPKVKNKKRPVAFILGLFLVFLLLLPIGILSGTSLWAFSNLAKTKIYLANGQFEEASQKAQVAKNGFWQSKEIVKKIGAPFTFVGLNKPIEKIYNLFLLGENVADSIDHVSQTATKMSSLTKGFVEGDDIDVVTLASTLRGEISPISQNLGLMEAQVLGVKTDRVMSLLSFFGFPTAKFESYIDQIPQARKTISSLESILTVLPEIAPQTEKKTYLVVFQNSAELRATGGFIGSYGLVNFDQGKLVNWQIYDIYSADGQLRGQIAPPDEILHYAGEPSWFMRDANWSPDFPLSAKRLEWFLEKETGQKVDGVIGVNLNAMSKLLEATGPLTLLDSGDLVTAQNFFQKAEYAAEINFFPGSTQKKDFIGMAAKSLLEKIFHGNDNDLPKLGQAVLLALAEKDIIFYFNSASAQKAFSQNEWTGEVAPEYCQRRGDNCISVVDSNLGANKANYFVSKSIQVASAIAKDGSIDTTVTINYKNDSPSETWPGGKYKNYLRILVPAGSKMTDFSIGDSRKPAVTPILTEKELALLKKEQFLVFQTMEGIYASFGALVEVPIQTSKRIVFKFRHPYRLQVSQENPVLNFSFIKQPGTGKDPLDFIVDYPSFLVPAVPLAFPQKLIYNSDLGTNRTFEIKFKRQI